MGYSLEWGMGETLARFSLATLELRSGAKGSTTKEGEGGGLYLSSSLSTASGFALNRGYRKLRLCAISLNLNTQTPYSRAAPVTEAPENCANMLYH